MTSRASRSLVFFLCLAVVLAACGGGGGGGGGNPVTYTLTYEPNGATGGTVPVDAHRYTQGQSATVLGNTGNLVRAGYQFTGWNTRADGSGVAYAPGQSCVMPGASIVLYAHWGAGSGGLSVGYDANGATGGSVPVDPTSYGVGQTVTVAANTGGLVYPGYRFVGWQTKSDGSGTAYAPDSTFTLGSVNVTLYALWAGGYAYTVNHNEGAEGAISQFTIGPNGALTPMFTPSVDAGGTDTRYVSVDPAGKYLYATNLANSGHSGSLTQFAIDQANGALGPMSPPTVPIPSAWNPGPVAGVAHPGGSWFYEIMSVSQAVWGTSAAGIVQLDVGTTGALTSPSMTVIPNYNGWVQPTAIAMEPSARYAYLGAGAWACPDGQGCIVEYGVDAGSGALTHLGDTGTLDSASGWVYVDDVRVLQLASGEYVYATNGYSSGEIFEFSVNADGTLTPLGSLPVAPTVCTCATSGNYATAGQIALHPSGKYAYVTFSCCSSLQSVAQFTVDQDHGTLSPMTPATVLSSGSSQSIALDPRGEHAYVTSGSTGFASHSIAQYAIDPGTGALTLMSNPTVDTGATGPSGIVTVPVH